MNDILFSNNNKASTKKLAVRRLKAAKQRNLFVILAVILTTTLFASLFSIGGGFLDQVQQIEQRQFGTAHASVKFLSAAQYHALSSSTLKKEISFTRLVGTGANAELSKLSVEIRYAEDASAKSFLCYPSAGKMPQTENEAAVSTLVLDALGIPHKLNTVVPLSISVDGELYEKEFTLCGFWEGYPLASAQEVWVALSFADQIAPASEQTYEESGKYAGLFCADINFFHSRNIEEQLSQLVADAGVQDLPYSVNESYEPVYLRGDIDISFLLVVIGLLGMILFAGYLIIYNLFFISVAQDIQFFGLLRTIGASGRQLKSIVRRQALTLGVVSLVPGLLCGYAIGQLLLPFVLSQININTTGVYRIHPLVLAGAAFFSLLTVYISSLRPCACAAKISAVEAVRYSGMINGITTKARKSRKITPFTMALENLMRSRKKALLVILSLSLSLILLNTTYTAVTGFDMEKYFKENAVADFYITDFSVKSSVYYDKNLSGVSEAFLATMQQLPGLENSASVYAKEILQPLSDHITERLIPFLPAQEYEELEQKGGTYSLVYGLDNSLQDKITLKEGTWDNEKWLSGEAVIVNDFFYDGHYGSSGSSPLYQTGDLLVLTDDKGGTHSFTVMGMGSLNYNLNAQYYADLGLSILLPSECYQELYGTTQPLCTIFNVDDANIYNAEELVNNYCTNVENNMTYISHQTYEQEFQRDKFTYTMIGGVLSIILALIGLLNFANTVATSITARQKELAVLHAVGMNHRQIKLMLIMESIAYIILALFLTATIGTGISYLICTNLISNMWAFVYHFTLTPVLICLPFLLAAAVFLPLSIHRNINRKSIVVQLRME